MRTEEFRKAAYQVVDWMAWYMDNVSTLPVKAEVKPGDILSRLQDSAPEEGEPFDSIFREFLDVVLPGMTHWQSPSFFAYFPANSSPPSVIAEMITATLAAQCMIWETSPAATEMEQRVMEWLRDSMGLPSLFEGVIQDTASTATLAALLSARERVTGFRSNESGMQGLPPLRVYCSGQTHSSIEKAVKIAGYGRENLVKTELKSDLSIDPQSLAHLIEADIGLGYLPAAVVATLGTTGTTAIDPIREVGEVCRRHGVWFHVDAALAGTALLLPELRHIADGIEMADSFVFNPHKWMFTNFDCSAYFVKDADHLIKTFEILPEYLKTRTRGEVNDYRDWGVPLGRRFRALKLWMVIKSYGVDGLRAKIRHHISLASWLADQIVEAADFELFAPPLLNTVCFRYTPSGYSPIQLDDLNRRLNHALNDTGQIYLTHTVAGGRYTLRMVTSQTNVELEHVSSAWNLIREMAAAISQKRK